MTLHLHLFRSARGYVSKDNVLNPVDITLSSLSYSLSLGGIFSCSDVIQQNVPQSHHKTPNTTLNHLYILAVTCMIDTEGISPVAAVGNDTSGQLPAQLLTALFPLSQYCRQINVHALLRSSLPGFSYHVTQLYIRIGSGYVIGFIILVFLLEWQGAGQD